MLFSSPWRGRNEGWYEAKATPDTFLASLKSKKVKSRGVNRQHDPTVLYLTKSICPGGRGKKSMGLREAVRGLITFRPLQYRSNRWRWRWLRCWEGLIGRRCNWSHLPLERVRLTEPQHLWLAETEWFHYCDPTSALFDGTQRKLESLIIANYMLQKEKETILKLKVYEVVTLRFFPLVQSFRVRTGFVCKGQGVEYWIFGGPQ